MTLRAVLFDVGDTLLEHWAGPERTIELAVPVLRREFGDREWYGRLLTAELGPNKRGHAAKGSHLVPNDDALRQETLRWYEEWFANSSIGIDDIDLDRLRVACTVPLDLVSELVPGAAQALRWSKARDLRVILVTNTLSRGEAQVWEDWRRFGLADAIDGIVTSHDTGWQKPHRRMFERALELARTSAAEAVMVGDRTDADIIGAKRLGMRAVLRRTTNPGAMDDVGVAPDAIIDDLTELPGVLSAWLEVPNAHGPLRRQSAEGR